MSASLRPEARRRGARRSTTSATAPPLWEMRVAEWLRGGPKLLVQGLVSDDIFDSMLRQLASAGDFRLTGDSEAVAQFLGI